MLAASALAVATAITIFGWGDVHFYTTEILPRSLEGEVIDPYDAGNGTLTTLLRRSFVMEPELNPYPLWSAPIVFFFLRPFSTLLILGCTLLGLASGGPDVYPGVVSHGSRLRFCCFRRTQPRTHTFFCCCRWFCCCSKRTCEENISDRFLHRAELFLVAGMGPILSEVVDIGCTVLRGRT